MLCFEIKLPSDTETESSKLLSQFVDALDGVLQSIQLIEDLENLILATEDSETITQMSELERQLAEMLKRFRVPAPAADVQPDAAAKTNTG